MVNELVAEEFLTVDFRTSVNLQLYFYLIGTVDKSKGMELDNQIYMLKF